MEASKKCPNCHQANMVERIRCWECDAIFEDKKDETTKAFWNNILIHAAIAAMNGHCANPRFESHSPEEINELSMLHAKDMVKRLKEI